MARPADHTGRIVGMLTYLYNTGDKAPSKHYIWVAQCECGELTRVATCNIAQNRSCGCRVMGNERYIGVSVYQYTYRAIKQRHHQRFTGEVVGYEQYAELAASNCLYCDSPPSNMFQGRSYQGLDRVDNNRGYTSDNVVPCCDMCNSFKSAYSVEQFIDHARRIAAKADL